MKKIALLFPGQGSQYVGMAKEFKDAHQFKLIKLLTGLDLQSMMLEGPEDQLKLTENTQPTIVMHSWLIWEKLNQILESKNIIPTVTLGHSVGEYAALAAAGAIPWAQAVKAVHWRGKFMQEAVPVGKGKMIAMLKAPLEAIEQACKESSRADSQVSAANYNSAEQVVISGEASACERVLHWFKNRPAIKFRAIELPVSAPFHSAMMKPAQMKMEKILADITWSKTDIAYIANIDARLYPPQTMPDQIKKNLLMQIPGAVRWMQSLALIEAGTLCLEVGPGKVLSGLMGKTRPDLKVLTLDTEGAWEEFAKALEAN